LSPMSRPWFGSSEFPLTGAAKLPGPETLRMLASKSSISSNMAELDPLLRAVVGLKRV
jgi:hypothetical protein